MNGNSGVKGCEFLPRGLEPFLDYFPVLWLRVIRLGFRRLRVVVDSRKVFGCPFTELDLLPIDHPHPFSSQSPTPSLSRSKLSISSLSEPHLPISLFVSFLFLTFSSLKRVNISYLIKIFKWLQSVARNQSRNQRNQLRDSNLQPTGNSHPQPPEPEVAANEK